MKILYITDNWLSLNDILYNGSENMNGMPAFEKVLKKLVLDGHDIDMIIYDYNYNNKKLTYKITSSWFKNINIINHVYIKNNSSYKKVFSNIKCYIDISSACKKAVKSKNYDFIYGHGPASESANIVAHKNKISFGVRHYGNVLYSLLKTKGLIYSSLSRPFDIYSFIKSKEFLLVTNDGSPSIKAYNFLNKKGNPYKFYHWLNGYTKYNENFIYHANIDLKKPYLLYIARITDWKRQHLAIQLISLLKEKGVVVNLYIAGQVGNEKYNKYLIDLINELKLKEQVYFLGTIDNNLVPYLVKNSLACLSFYDICNLGNVFIEYFTLGGIVISCNDGSLDGLIENNKNGYLIDNIEQAVDIVELLLNNPDKVEVLKKEAKNTALEKIKTWDERIEDEINLILSCVEKKGDIQFENFNRE